MSPTGTFWYLGTRYCTSANTSFSSFNSYPERCLIGRAVMGSDRLLDAREFGNDDAFLQSGFIGGNSRTAREIAPAERSDGWRGELGVGGKLLGIGNRAVRGHPVAFCHRGPR